MSKEARIKRAADQHQVADPEAFTAEHMTVVSCEHGTIWIRLHDSEGKVRAFGCFDLDGALRFNDAVLDEINAVITVRPGACGSVH